jgi:DNA polymerase-3 subunit gamma/tau
MSYQVLARKWRPATFEQVVGQSHVLHALTNALTQNRLHHAYLFSGTRGVGKTSLARLFAKGLNCEQGITASPCGQCASCVEIAQGRFVDLIEVDAASRTKVDDTRELLDNVQYRPSRGRYKVYLIDEVHMLSRSSFNALLKTLEEPPEHVKFLLATTDPQRLPVTVLSRCLQFNLKSLTLDEICLQLANILRQEGVSFDDGALKLLAKAANGSMRDALSLTDQAIAFGAGQIQVSQVQTMLGTIDEQYVILLLQALCDGDVANLMQMIDEVLSFGADPFEVLRSLLELLHQITLTQFAPAAAQLSQYAEQIKAFASQLRPEQVQLYYQLLLNGRKDLPHAPDPKSGLEMTLLRAVAFVPETPIKGWPGESGGGISLSAAQTTEQSKVSPNGPLVSGAMINESVASEPVGSKALTKDESIEGERHLMADAPKCQELDSSDGDDSDVDGSEALAAEQALILSQAASQGLTSEPASVASTIEAASEKELKFTADPSEASLFDSVMANTAYDGQDDELADQDPSDYEAYLASQMGAASGEAEDAHNRASSPSDATTARGSAPADDDLLDAVLAARQFLLSDLDDTSSKESDTKKREVGRQAYVPPKPNASPLPNAPSDHSNAAEIQAQKDVQDNDVKDDECCDGETSSVAAASQVLLGRDDAHYDRPPWESPAEDASLSTSHIDTDNLQQEAISESPDPLRDKVSPSEMVQPASDLFRCSVDQPMASHPQAEVSQPAVIDDQVSGDSTDLRWYRLMSALDIGGRVRQLAVNSVCRQFVDPLPLVLKPNQKHLESAGSVAQLEEALAKALGEPCQVAFSVGIEQGRETPLEIRQRFHQELLVQAHHGLINDDNIRWLTQTMNVQMDPDSLSYAPELLGQRGQVIELIDKSNFIEQRES